MSRTRTMTVRRNETLSEFVAANVGENGAYENVSEYVRDLIRRDKERAEREASDRLKTELTHAFAAPDTAYKPLNAADIRIQDGGILALGRNLPLYPGALGRGAGRPLHHRLFRGLRRNREP